MIDLPYFSANILLAITTMQQRSIQIKSLGNKAKSLFKYGLTYIAAVLQNALFQYDIDIFKFLSRT